MVADSRSSMCVLMPPAAITGHSSTAARARCMRLCAPSSPLFSLYGVARASSSSSRCRLCGCLVYKSMTVGLPGRVSCLPGGALGVSYHTPAAPLHVLCYCYCLPPFVRCCPCFPFVFCLQALVMPCLGYHQTPLSPLLLLVTGYQCACWLL